RLENLRRRRHVRRENDRQIHGFSPGIRAPHPKQRNARMGRISLPPILCRRRTSRGIERAQIECRLVTRPLTLRRDALERLDDVVRANAKRKFISPLRMERHDPTPTVISEDPCRPQANERTRFQIHIGKGTLLVTTRVRDLREPEIETIDVSRRTWLHQKGGSRLHNVSPAWVLLNGLRGSWRDRERLPRVLR